MANKRTDGEQTDVKQRVGRQIDGWGLVNRRMDGEQKDGRKTKSEGKLIDGDW